LLLKVLLSRENEIAQENVRTFLAQRGMLNSGTEGAVTLASELAGAEARAQIRASADEVVANEQSRFLQIGLGQNPGAAYSANLSNMATEARREANYSNQVAGQAIGTAITTVGSALSDYTRNRNTGNSNYSTINTGAEYGNVS
jgi:hypothetical protein